MSARRSRTASISLTGSLALAAIVAACGVSAPVRPAAGSPVPSAAAAVDEASLAGLDPLATAVVFGSPLPALGSAAVGTADAGGGAATSSMSLSVDGSAAPTAAVAPSTPAPKRPATTLPPTPVPTRRDGGSASNAAPSPAASAVIAAAPLPGERDELAFQPITFDIARLSAAAPPLPSNAPLAGGASGQPISGAGLRSTARDVRAYFDHLSDPATLPTDANGIPMVSYNGKLEYNTVTIAQQALAHYGIWLYRGNQDSWATFIKYTDWLVANQKPDGIWEYTFAFGPQPVPWWSAMAEGQAISALVRAYRETRDPKYRRATDLALATITRPQSQRGVTLVDNGYSWYEEYVPPYSPHTLNGFMFALAGVRDAYLTFGDPLSTRLWNNGLAALVHDLPRFEWGNWSCYSLYWPTLTGCNRATLGYHKVHIYELDAYYRWTGMTIFKTFHDRWESWLASPPPGI